MAEIHCKNFHSNSPLAIAAGAAGEMALIAICTAIALFASKIRVPFYPVPFTAQTFAIVTFSLFVGRRRALLSLLAFAAIWNPFCLTGGYIFGFFAVPLIIGNDPLKLGAKALIGRIFLSHLLILAMGTAVLSCFIGVRAAFVGGFLFFIPSEILKGTLAFTLGRAFGKFSSKLGQRTLPGAER
jgi:biotin transport system substrate-specific component